LGAKPHLKPGKNFKNPRKKFFGGGGPQIISPGGEEKTPRVPPQKRRGGEKVLKTKQCIKKDGSSPTQKDVVGGIPKRERASREKKKLSPEQTSM